jgi:hypothetical protein
MTTDANIIKIKRSGTSGAPSSLKLGELAYSYLPASGNPTNNGGDRLFIGANGVNVGTGNANDIIVIGGKYFTDLLDHERGILTASSALVVDANKKLDELLVDNLSLNGNTLSSTDTNGNIALAPNGNGIVTVTTSGQADSFTITDTGQNGANIRLVGNGSTTPNKTIRSFNGNLEVVNSTYATVILSLSDAGYLTVNKLTIGSGAGSFSLPTADGTSGYVLTTNGSGVVSWAAAAASLTVDADSGGPQTVSLTTDTLKTTSGDSNIAVSVAKSSTTVTTTLDLAADLTGIDSVSSGGNTGAVNINTSPDGTTNYHWQFNTDGSFTLPSQGLISEAVSPSGVGHSIILTPYGGSDANQKLIVYPGGSGDGNHLHLTTSALGTTSIFLGNDSQYVRTRTDGAMVIGTNDNDPEVTPGTGHRWVFNTDGTTKFPGFTFPASNGSTGQVLVANGSTGVLSWGTISSTLYIGTTSITTGNSSGSNTTIAGLTEIDVGDLVLSGNTIENGNNATGSVQLIANGGSADKTFTFGTDGNIVLPGGGLVSSNGYSSGSTVSALFATSNYAGLDWKGTNTIYADATGIEIYTNSSGTGYTSGVENYWGFNTDGTTQFPNYKFPSADGSANQVLKTNGSGVLSWTTVSSTFYIGSTSITTGNSSGSITTIAGLNEIDVGDLVLSGSTVSTGADTGDVTIVANTGTDRSWVFDGSGVLTLPVTDNSQHGGKVVFPSAISGTLATINYNGDGDGGGAFELQNTDGTNTLYVGLNLDGNAISFTNTTPGSGSKYWNFNSDGTTDFPNYKFPAANGSTGQVLTANGSTGHLAWTTLSQTFYIGSTQITTGNASGDVTALTGINSISSAANSGNVTLNASGGHQWTFNTDGTTTFNGAYSLPASDGTDGYVLTTNGDGDVTWQASAATLGLYGDSGNGSVDLLNQNLTVAGSTNIATSVSNQTVTVTLNSTLTGLTEVDVGTLTLYENKVATSGGVGAVTIEANAGSSNHLWTFGTDGNLELPMGGGTITNVPTPQAPNEVANKAYVDATASGLQINSPVIVATTAPLSTLGGTVSYADGPTPASASVGATLTFTTPITALDNYTFTGGERILVKDQANAKQNGVYVYTSSTTWTRAEDFDQPNDITGADFMFVRDGLVNGSTGWVQTNQSITSIGATGSNITFVQFSAANSYLAGDGVQITGNTIAVKLATNSGLSTSGGSLTISGIAGTATTTGLTYSSGVLQIGVDNSSIDINGTSGQLEIKSTWSGQSAITTVGTISTGTWQGTKVAETYGGTNQSTYAKGDILYASASNTLSKLAAGTDGQTLQLQNGVPVWADMDGGTY